MVTSIFLRGWFILMITVNLLNIDAQNLVGTKCLSGRDKCYTLFRADFAWQEAHDDCLYRNQHLATILDAPTQSLMQQFAEDQDYPEGAAHAWVAGRRSDDTTWRDLNGSLFSYTGGIGADGDGSCMLLNGEGGLSDKHNLHLAVPCANQSNPCKAVCEYDETKEVCSTTVDRVYQPSVNKCNTVSSEKYDSWHDARQYCQSQGWQLAHTGAGTWHFYNRLTSTSKQPIGNEAALWIGVQKRPWVWKAGYTQDVYPAVTYWRPSEGMNSDEECMHIELNVRGLWADKHCDVTSAYFICQDYQDQPAKGNQTLTTTTMAITPTTTTTTTPTTLTAATATAKAPTPPATSTKAPTTTTTAPSTATTKALTTTTLKTGPPMNRESPTVISNTGVTAPPPTEKPLTSPPTQATVYIIIGVGGLVLVAVIIIVVVVVCGRRKRTEGDQVENVNSRTGPLPEGDVYAVPIKNRNRNPDDDLQIVDNEKYGAGLDYPIRNRNTTPDGASENLPIKTTNRNPDDDLEIVDNEMYGDV